MNNNQRDSRWANIPVGTGEQTIGQIGCTICVIGDVVGLTPDQVNDKLNALPPDANGNTGYAYGNLIYWSRLGEAFPNFTFNRVWSYNNDDVLAHVPNVIVEAPALSIGGRGSHWTNYIGSHELKDPWTGLVRPTNDFPNPTGYCTIAPISVIVPPLPQPNPGYPATYVGATVQVNGITYQSYENNGQYLWKIEVHTQPTSRPVETPPPPVEQPMGQPTPVSEVSTTPQITPEPVVTTSTPTIEVPFTHSGQETPPVQVNQPVIKPPMKLSFTLSSHIVWIFLSIKNVLKFVWGKFWG